MSPSINNIINLIWYISSNNLQIHHTYLKCKNNINLFLVYKNKLILFLHFKYDVISGNIIRVDWGKEADCGKKTFSFKIEKFLKNKKILSPCGDKDCG